MRYHLILAVGHSSMDPYDRKKIVASGHCQQFYSLCTQDAIGNPAAFSQTVFELKFIPPANS